MSVPNTLVSMMMMRSVPQDLPYSSRLFRLLLMLYIMTGLLAFSSLLETGTALSNMMLDALVILGYTWTLLRAFQRLPRFRQTVMAMLGTGCLFHLMAWPLLMQTIEQDGEQMIAPLASLLMLMLLAWSLMVNAHIYKQAMEFSLTSALLLSFSLFFISLAVSRYLLPVA